MLETIPLDNQQVLVILTTLSILILLGILISIAAKKLKISNVLFLIIAGLIIGFLTRGTQILELSRPLVITIALLALVLIVFYGSSRFEIKALDTFSTPALKLTVLSLILYIIVIGAIFTAFVFQEWSVVTILYSAIFATIISGTDPGSVFSMLKNKSNRVVEFLEVEAILNTPIVVLIPFVFLDIIGQLGLNIVLSWEVYLAGILTQILVGIGSGILVGLIFFKAMRKFYSEEVSPLALISAALLSYILAENLAGNGVLAVAVLGFVFGNMYISHKDVLQEFSGMLSNALEILVFILLGFMIELKFTWTLIGMSLIIFVIIVTLRYIATLYTLNNQKYSTKQKLFIALNMSKGIAVAVMVFSLAISISPELTTISHFTILIMIYSLILSTFVDKFAKEWVLNQTIPNPPLPSSKDKKARNK